jgi:plasmid stabilization system protein ParE
MDYFVSQKADLDINEIWDYIAEDNINAADKLIDKIYETFKRLSEMPFIGNVKSDWTDKELRFWSIKKYLIVYEINNNNSITIVRVLSEYRDVISIIED